MKKSAMMQKDAGNLFRGDAVCRRGGGELESIIIDVQESAGLVSNLSILTGDRQDAYFKVIFSFRFFSTVEPADKPTALDAYAY